MRDLVEKITGCNVVLVVIDTLRYQGGPHLQFDKPFAFKGSEDFVSFENAIAPAPWTLPSHVSLFTGQYLRHHGIHEDRKLKESIDLFIAFSRYNGSTLTGSLRSRGYNTYGAVANPALLPGTGFDNGFDRYDFIDFLKPLGGIQADLTKQVRENLNEDERRKFTGDSEDFHNFVRRLKLDGQSVSAEEITESMLYLNESAQKIGYPEHKGGEELIASVKSMGLKEPFYLFMNFMEAHDPYDTDGVNLAYGDGRVMLSDLILDSKISDQREDRLLKSYSTDVLHVRELMSDLVSVLKEKGVYENTLIILTSDHGQGFRENGFYGHGTFLYDEICRIPLSIKMPPGLEKVIPEASAESDYVSLVSVRKFIEACAAGSPNADLLFDDAVFSESYGIPNNYYEMFGKDSEYTGMIEKFDYERLAVYSKSGKLTIRTDSGGVEEILVPPEYKGDERRAAISNLLRDLEEFCELDDLVRIPTIQEVEEKLGN